jgi:hypothetical protein
MLGTTTLLTEVAKRDRNSKEGTVGITLMVDTGTEGL